MLPCVCCEGVKSERVIWNHQHDNPSENARSVSKRVEPETMDMRGEESASSVEGSFSAL